MVAAAVAVVAFLSEPRLEEEKGRGGGGGERNCCCIVSLSLRAYKSYARDWGVKMHFKLDHVITLTCMTSSYAMHGISSSSSIDLEYAALQHRYRDRLRGHSLVWL